MLRTRLTLASLVVAIAAVAAGRLPARVVKLADDPEAWVTR